MTVIIKLYDKKNKQPIRFAMVELKTDHSVFRDDSDGNGVVDFDYINIPDDTYIIKVDHPHYRPYLDKHFISGNNYKMNLSLTKAFD